MYNDISFDSKNRQGSEEPSEPMGSIEAIMESFVSFLVELIFYESNVSRY